MKKNLINLIMQFTLLKALSLSLWYISGPFLELSEFNSLQDRAKIFTYLVKLTHPSKFSVFKTCEHSLTNFSTSLSPEKNVKQDSSFEFSESLANQKIRKNSLLGLLLVTRSLFGFTFRRFCLRFST